MDRRPFKARTNSNSGKVHTMQFRYSSSGIPLLIPLLAVNPTVEEVKVFPYSEKQLYCYHHRLWSNGYILNGEPTKRCSIRTNVGQEWWRLLEQKWNMACDWLAVLKCYYRGL